MSSRPPLWDTAFLHTVPAVRARSLLARVNNGQLIHKCYLIYVSIYYLFCLLGTGNIPLWLRPRTVLWQVNSNHELEDSGRWTAGGLALGVNKARSDRPRLPGAQFNVIITTSYLLLLFWRIVSTRLTRDPQGTAVELWAKAWRETQRRPGRLPSGRLLVWYRGPWARHRNQTCWLLPCTAMDVDGCVYEWVTVEQKLLNAQSGHWSEKH